MPIISFFSYKGGVGRTLTMVNLGVWLARQGYRVGMLDFDLDSPGLVHVFREEEIICEGNDLPNIILKQAYDDTMRVNRSVSHLLADYKCVKGGELFYIPTLPDSDVVDDIEEIESLLLRIKTIFESYMNLMGLNYLLVDARPGVTNWTGLISPLSDQMVVVARLDRQNQYGLKKVVGLFQEVTGKVHLVANMVPDPEKFRQHVTDFEKAIGEGFECVLPLILDDLFQEKIRTIVEPEGETSLQIRKLMKAIAGISHE